MPSNRTVISEGFRLISRLTGFTHWRCKLCRGNLITRTDTVRARQKSLACEFTYTETSRCPSREVYVFQLDFIVSCMHLAVNYSVWIVKVLRQALAKVDGDLRYIALSLGYEVQENERKGTTGDHYCKLAARKIVITLHFWWFGLLHSVDANTAVIKLNWKDRRLLHVVINKFTRQASRTLTADSKWACALADGRKSAAADVLVDKIMPFAVATWRTYYDAACCHVGCIR